MLQRQPRSAITAFVQDRKLQNCRQRVSDWQDCKCSVLLHVAGRIPRHGSASDVMWRELTLAALARERAVNASEGYRICSAADTNPQLSPELHRCMGMLEPELFLPNAGAPNASARGWREHYLQLGLQEAVFLSAEERSALGFNTTAQLPALRSQQFNSCALVGNSGLLLRHKYGRLIDAQDVVLRINSGITVGYEAHVGNRTDFVFQRDMTLRFRGWVEHQEHATRLQDVAMRLHENRGRVLYFVDDAACARNISDVECTAKQEAVAYMSQNGVEAHLLSNPRWEEVAKQTRSDVFNSNRSSTGELALWVALSLCKHVHVFGFYTHHRLSYHYAEATEGKAKNCATCKDQMHVLALLQRRWPSRVTWHIRGSANLLCWNAATSEWWANHTYGSWLKHTEWVRDGRDGTAGQRTGLSQGSPFYQPSASPPQQYSRSKLAPARPLHKFVGAPSSGGRARASPQPPRQAGGKPRSDPSLLPGKKNREARLPGKKSREARVSATQHPARQPSHQPSRQPKYKSSHTSSHRPAHKAAAST